MSATDDLIAQLTQQASPSTSETKQATLATKTEEKAARLKDKFANSVNSAVDGDTVRVDGFPNLRLSQGDGFSYDSLETRKPDKYYLDNPKEFQRAKDQIPLLEKMDNVLPGTYTLEDVWARAGKQKQELQDFNDANQNSEGNVSIESFGSDTYDRLLVDLKDKDGNSYVGARNNPQQNVKYDSKFNSKAQRIAELEQQLVDLDAKEKREKDAALTDDQAGSVLGQAAQAVARTGISLFEGGTKIAGAYDKARLESLGNIEDEGSRDLAKSIARKDAYRQSLIKEQGTNKLKNVTDRGVTIDGITHDKSLFELTAEEKAFQSAKPKVIKKPDLPDTDVRVNNKATTSTAKPYQLPDIKLSDAEILKREKKLTGRIETSKAVVDKAKSYINYAGRDRLAKKNEELVKKASTHFNSADVHFERGDKLKGIKAYATGMVQTVVNVGDLGTTDLGETVGFLADSAFEMWGLNKAAAITLTSMVLDKQYDTQKDYVAKHGKRAEGAEQAKQLALNIASAAMAKGGNDLIFKDLKKTFVGKVIPDKAINGALRKLPKSGQNIVMGLSKVHKISPSKAMARIAQGTIGEGISEAGEDALHELAKGNEVKREKVLSSGQLGAAIGGTTSAGLAAANVPGDAKKDLGKVVKKGVERAEKKFADAKAKSEAYRDVDSPSYDPVESVKHFVSTDVIAQQTSNDERVKGVAEAEKHFQNLGAQLVGSFSDTSPEGVKKTAKLQAAVEKYNDTITGLKASVADKNDKATTKVAEQVVTQPDTPPNDAQIDVLYQGAEDMTKDTLVNLQKNKNLPKEVKDLVDTTVAYQEALENVVTSEVASGKSEIDVTADILGTSVNTSGKKSLGAHMSAVRNAVELGDAKGTETSLSALQKFSKIQTNKLQARRDALALAQTTNTPQTTNDGFVTDPSPKGINSAKKQIRAIETEAKLLEAGYNLMSQVANRTTPNVGVSADSEAVVAEATNTSKNESNVPEQTQGAFDTSVPDLGQSPVTAPQSAPESTLVDTSATSKEIIDETSQVTEQNAIQSTKTTELTSEAETTSQANTVITNVTESVAEKSPALKTYFENNPEVAAKVKTADKLLKVGNPEKNNVIHKYPDMVNQLSDTTFREEFVKEYNLSEDNVNTLATVNRFTKEFKGLYNDILVKPVSHKGKLDAITKDALFAMRDAEGKIGDDVIRASAAAGYRFLHTDALETSFNTPEDVNRILGNVADNNLSEDAYASLSHMGTQKSLITDAISNDIMSMLNIQAKSDAEVTEVTRLANALADMTLATLASGSNPEIELINISNKDLNEFRNEEQDGEGQIQMVRMVDGKFDERAGQRKATDELMNKLFNSENFHVYPTSEPVTNIQKTSNRSASNISPIQKKAVLTNNAVEWTMNTGVVESFNRMSEKAQLKMLGWKDPNKFHSRNKLSIEGKNRKLENDLRAFNEFSSNNPDTFFFENTVWGINRIGQKQNTVSPTNSTMHRHLVAMKGGQATGVSTTDINDPKLFWFKVAVAQAMDIKMDNNVITNVDALFNDDNGQLSMKDPVYQAAIEAINGDMNDNAIVEAVDKAGEDMHSFDGLSNLANYIKAHNNGKKFDYNMFIETDGTTDGPVTSVLQTAEGTEAGSYTVETLIRGGIMVDGRYDNATDQADDNEHLDVYQHVVLAVEKVKNDYRSAKPEALTKFFGNISEDQMNSKLSQFSALFPEVISEKNEVTSAGRKVAKQSRTPVGYAAGDKSVIEKLGQYYLDQIYNQIESARTPADLKKIYGSLTELTGTTIRINPTDRLTENLPQSVENYIVGLAEAYEGQATIDVYAEQLGGLTKTRGNVIAAVKLQTEVFIKVWDKRLAEIANPTAQDRAKLMIELRDLGLIPGYKHATSTGLQDRTQILKSERKWQEGKENQMISNKPIRYRVAKMVNGRLELGPAQTKKSITSPTYTNEWASDSGVRGFVNAILSMDGSVNATLMAENSNMLNLFDAGAYPAALAQDSTKRTNEVYRDINTNYNLMTAVDEAFNISLDYAKNNFNAEELTEIESNMKNTLEGIFGENVNLSTDTLQKHLKDETKRINDNKANILARTSTVDHTVIPGGEAKTAKPLTEDALNKLQDTLMNDLGVQESSGDTLNLSDFNGIVTEPVTPNNVEALFDNLTAINTANISANHTDNLKKVINNLVKPLLRSVNDVTLTQTVDGDKNTGVLVNGRGIYMKATAGVQSTNSAMSAQEVYVHELTHVVWNHGLKNTPLARAKLADLFKQAEAVITYKDFLKKDANGNVVHILSEEAEVAAAKKMYDHIFNNKEGYLHEFATFGLTNEAFATALENVTLAFEERNKADTLGAKLENLFKNILDFITRQVFQAKSKTVGGALNDLAGDVNNINVMTRGKVSNYIEKTQAINSATAKAIHDFVVEPIYKFKDANTGKYEGSSIPRKVTVTAANVFTSIGDAEVKRQMDKIAYKFNLTRSNFAHRLMVEIRGANERTKAWFPALRHAKHNIDAMRETVFKQTVHQIEGMFADKLDNNTWLALNYIGKNNVAPLFGKVYNESDLAKLYMSTSFRQKEIKKITAQIKAEYGKNALWYISQAESLGSIMTRGSALYGINEMSNAYNIATLEGTGTYKASPIGDLKKAEQLISQLSTLHSINYVPESAKTIIGTQMNKEFARSKSNKVERDGMTHFLSMHELARTSAIDKNFGGKKRFVSDGHTAEIYDSSITMQTSIDPNDQSLIMKGYVKRGPVKKSSDDPSKEQLYIYTSAHGLMEKRVTGIVSFANLQASGSSVNDRNFGPDVTAAEAEAKSQKENDYIAKSMQRKINAIFAGRTPRDTFTANGENHPIPLMGRTGIKGYRYQMSEEAKVNLLGKEDVGHHVLGKMIAAVPFKVEAQKANQLVVAQAKEDYDKYFRKDPTSFIHIGPESKIKEHKELYRLLPDDMKAEIESAFGSRGMFVQEEVLHLVFGFRKLSVTESAAVGKVLSHLPARGEILTKHAMHIAGDIWQSLVARGKRNIVILTPSVLIGNVTSNGIISATAGMDPKYIVKQQAIALKSLQDYQNKSRQRDNLQRLIDSGAKNKAAKQVNVDRLTKDIEANPVHPLIQEGLFQSIVEDVVESETEVVKAIGNAFPKAKGLIKTAGDIIPDQVVNAYDQLVLSPDTKAGKLLLDATQYSDFVARFAMHKFLIEEKGKTPEEALDQVVETFINYDETTSPELQWANDMGILMYTKFWLRIQRVIVKSFHENPANMLSVALGQELMGKDLSDIVDSNLLSATPLSKLTTPDEIVDNAFNISAFNYLPSFITDMFND